MEAEIQIVSSTKYYTEYYIILDTLYFVFLGIMHILCNFVRLNLL